MGISFAGGGAGTRWGLKANATFTNTFTISNLDGNTDKVYWLVVRARGVASADTALLRINGDTANNYTSLTDDVNITGAGTIASTFGGSTATSSSAMVTGTPTKDNYVISVMIHCVSGHVRSYFIDSGAGVDGTGAGGAIEASRLNGMGVWGNTADNITSIGVVLTAAITSGEYYLFYPITA